MDPLAAILETFFQECEEQLAELESGLLAMEGGDTDPETINAVFRAVHSIKGGAGAFSLESLIRFAHVFETALDEMRSGRLAPSGEVLKSMLRAADVLADLVRAAQAKEEGEHPNAAILVEELKAMSGAAGDADESEEDWGDFEFKPTAVAFETPEAPETPAGAAGFKVTFKPRADLYAKANEAALLLRELGRLGAIEVELNAHDVPPLHEMDPEAAYLSWTITVTGDADETAVREVFEWVDGDCELTIEPLGDAPQADAGEAPFDLSALLARVQGDSPAMAAPEPDAPVAFEPIPEPPAPAPVVVAAPAPIAAANETALDGPAAAAARKTEAGATIRVDLDRVDRLIDLVGELVINQAVLAQRVMEAGLARASAVAMGLDELEQLTREIQDSVMAIRAQPVKSVFQRMPRLVREVAAMTGKPVRLVTEGEGTEVDKTVIERLADPLTHMIRNAIDHGLESPEKRAVAGKPAEGVVRLSAAHRSGRIVIEVSDDGAGINRERVKSIAIEKGLISAEATLSDEEVDNLIFMPGFSTASEVSDISGRGVGMDVVRRSIQALGGRITITSRPGKGSTFTMSLPLTLAVLDGMVVSVQGQTLVAPITAIVETLQPKPADVHSLGGHARVISIRGGFVPLIDVGMALGYRREPLPASQGVALLIEGEGGARAALLVDAIQGQRQVVIKSLEANYRQVPGVAAATILGDGRVALILDIDTIVAVSRGEMRKAG
ncbi:MAG: chemotaxis protein CheA [Alphaproteobacteria bacterium]|nr:chemotaxis protein CheA [Alphaproteobacteria bacterium]MBU1515843.1 chemotaxis protein CheA [Alphaproteobacteria bacterium]MBU2094065.1 chemotaxis protein CheA [Alphaproteobacteria bacterium]MBU2151417.1 chemotaxis protein CheA [Alphaproteobacteria bacterium]MBU2305307.1 chemotaxis protein CheA [Alphaproteobacteria bacterium]